MSKERRRHPTLQPIGEHTDLNDVTMRIPVNSGNASPAPKKGITTIRVVAGRDMLSFVSISPKDQILIGRDESAELRLQDRAVSNRHAIVNSDANGNMIIIDLGSTNGTFVNGQRVERSRLRSGDYLEIGDVALRVSSLSAAELRHLTRVVNRLQSAHRDPLTGLLTRAYLDEELPKLLKRCVDLSAPISCVFIDLDKFKPINDTYGHQVGDEVLKNIARIIMMQVRSGDPSIRYGGDEILVIFPGISEEIAYKVVSRIQRAVMQHDWGRIAAGLSMSASFGIATHVADDTLETWLKHADESVYKAKAMGRNAIVVYK